MLRPRHRYAFKPKTQDIPKDKEETPSEKVNQASEPDSSITLIVELIAKQGIKNNCDEYVNGSHGKIYSTEEKMNNVDKRDENSREESKTRKFNKK